MRQVLGIYTHAEHVAVIFLVGLLISRLNVIRAYNNFRLPVHSVRVELVGVTIQTK